MKLTERFTLNLEGIELSPPDRPVQEDDVVIGEVPVELRPLWSFYSQAVDAHHALHAKLKPGEDVRHHPDAADRNEHRILHLAAEYAKIRFWHQVQAAIDPDDQFDNYGIRDDWKVYSSPKHHGPLDLLLMGGLLALLLDD